MSEPPHPEAGADDERTASFGFLMAEMSSFQGAMSSFQAEMSSLQFASSLSMFRTSESFGRTSFESQDSVGRVAGS